VSYCRLVKCAQEAAGKRDGTAGTKSGHASLTGALAEAAVLCLRNKPAGQKYLARLENKHGKGTALPVLAHPLARAVYSMVQRRVVCALDTLLQSEGRGAGAPAAYRGHAGRSLATGLCHAAPHASTNAHEPIGALPCPCAVDWMPALAPVHMVTVPEGDRVLPRPRTCAYLAHTEGQPWVCGGRDEGTEKLLGRRDPSPDALEPPPRWRSPLKKCLVPARWCTSRRQCRRHTVPVRDDAWRNHRGKN
jgi:hypothetical protein